MAAVVAWRSTITAVVGGIVGVPVGIVIGHQLWTEFAENINGVPNPTVPVLSVVLVALGVLVAGRIAARIPTAMVCRTQEARPGN